MLINVISLERRSDRRQLLIDHLYDLRLNYTFWTGIDTPLDPKRLALTNINLSHKRIVESAKIHRLPSVLVAEDDLRFSCSDSFRYYIDNTPESYDMYFGMIYSGHIQDGRIMHGFSGLQFYMVHERFYNVFLSAPETKHLDSWLGERCHEYEFKCCEPFVCYGESGYSDNFKRQWTFDEKKLPRKLYRVAV